MSPQDHHAGSLEPAAELPMLVPPALETLRPERVEPGEVPADLYRLLYRQVRGLAGGRPDLDDLVQEAAERALRAWSRFEGRSALSTWTYGIAYRTVVDRDRWYSRWKRRFSFASDDDHEPAAHEAASDASVEELERAKRLYAALDRLPAAKRAAVILHDLQGLEMKEVAEIVGTNERTVRSRLRDARKKLAEMLSSDPLFQEALP